jgi:hypothetical protein
MRADQGICPALGIASIAGPGIFIKQAFLEKLVVVVVPKDWVAIIALQGDV